MRYLTYEDFEFIINLFNTYPIPLTIRFFIKEQSDIDFLIGTFKARLRYTEFRQTNFYDYAFLSINGVMIVLTKSDILDTQRHRRGNLIICDSRYSFIEINELYKPFANLKPVLGFLYWDPEFLTEYVENIKRRIINENKESN